MIDANQRERIAQAVDALDSTIPPTWQMVGVGLWKATGKVLVRAELHLHRTLGKKLLYIATGGCPDTHAHGMDLLLVRNVPTPEAYCGAYGSIGSEVSVAGRVWSVSYTVDLTHSGDGARPQGVSLGLGEGSPKWWLCDYRLVGQW